LTVEYSDLFDTPVTQQKLLSNGTTTFVITPLLANNTQYVGATNSIGYTNANSTFVFISAANTVKLQVLLPGETAVPGSSSGKNRRGYHSDSRESIFRYGECRG